jgi:hypothetical protein
MDLLFWENLRCVLIKLFFSLFCPILLKGEATQRERVE